MTEQQNHLKSVIEQQKILFSEIQDLNNQLTIKREMSLKLQGIYEYLTGTGVTLPEEEGKDANSETETTTEESSEES